MITRPQNPSLRELLFTVRGSIVGTRLDLQESIDFAAQGKVKATVETARIEDINTIFDRMHKGQIEGRVVLDMAS